MPYELVDENMRLLSVPETKLSRFCSWWGRGTSVSNLKTLVEPDAWFSLSRIGVEAKMVKGLRSLASVHWLQRIGSGEDPIPVPNWDVSNFVLRVASQRDDMCGLRSVKNLTSFLRGNKIKDTVRDVYGIDATHCPGGWCRVDQPRNYTQLLEHAPAWDNVRARVPYPFPTSRPLTPLNCHCTGAARGGAIGSPLSARRAWRRRRCR